MKRDVLQGTVVNDNLKVIEVRNYSVSSNQVEVIRQALENNSPLKVLLINASLNSNILNTLKQLFIQSSRLIFLDLSGNKLEIEQIATIAEILESKSLKYLYLNQCGVDEVGIASIANFLKKNCILIDLHARGNKFGEISAKVIADILIDNRTLRILDLYDNLINDSGAESIFEALCTNNTLKILSLGKNPLGDKVAPSLNNFLKSNLTIFELNLERTLLANNSLEVLIKLLPDNRTLKILNVASNKFHGNDIIELIQQLVHNTILFKIDIGDNITSIEGLLSINKLLTNNTNLKEINAGPFVLDMVTENVLYYMAKNYLVIKALRITFWDYGHNNTVYENVINSLNKNPKVRSVNARPLFSFSAPKLFKQCSKFNIVTEIDKNFFEGRIKEISNNIDQEKELQKEKSQEEIYIPLDHKFRADGICILIRHISYELFSEEKRLLLNADCDSGRIKQYKNVLKKLSDQLTFCPYLVYTLCKQAATFNASLFGYLSVEVIAHIFSFIPYIGKDSVKWCNRISTTKELNNSLNL